MILEEATCIYLDFDGANCSEQMTVMKDGTPVCVAHKEMVWKVANK